VDLGEVSNFQNGLGHRWSEAQGRFEGEAGIPEGSGTVAPHRFNDPDAP
jgi:hypothetical protein